jgi:mono/diheme cytochrome c family protein
MKRLVLALLLAAPLAAPAESGLEIFHTRCSRCHGEDGRGKTIFNTPSFLASRKTAEEMVKIVADGKAKMPSFRAQLGTQEIAAVVDYLRVELPRKQ